MTCTPLEAGMACQATWADKVYKTKVLKEDTMKRSALAMVLCCAAGSAFAIQVVPTSYSMPNGSSGSYAYWDDSYSGSGCKSCDGASLTGGLGDLTDGITATTSWLAAESPDGPGPYVGWKDVNPTITFNFGSAVSISSVSVNMDGSGIGGVAAPQSLTIAGRTYVVPPPSVPGPFAFVATGVDFSGTSLNMTIIRSGQWSFVSEVSFTSAVPEASTTATMASGLVALLALVHIRRRRVGA